MGSFLNTEKRVGYTVDSSGHVLWFSLSLSLPIFFPLSLSLSRINASKKFAPQENVVRNKRESRQRRRQRRRLR